MTYASIPLLLFGVVNTFFILSIVNIYITKEVYDFGSPIFDLLFEDCLTLAWCQSKDFTLCLMLDVGLNKSTVIAKKISYGILNENIDFLLIF